MAAPDHAQHLTTDSSCTGGGVHTCHGNGAEAQNGSGQLALTPQRSRAATLASPLTGRSEACCGRRGGVEG